MAQRLVRIGELARRTGVNPDVLRAWERRYALLRPVRSAGNYRLYSRDDEDRVRAMTANLGAGLPAGEAARVALADDPPGEAGGGDLGAAAADLRRALESFDDAGSQAALDALLAAFGFETVAREILLPYLRGLGDRWARGETSVAQEHFASVVLRGRLLGLARGWDRGAGPRALVACAPGEMHELGLIVFGLTLRSHGWRITYLGADTPADTALAAADTLQPDAVVIASLAADRFHDARRDLRALAQSAPLWLAGASLDHAFASETGARLLHGDPVDAAAELAHAHAPPPAVAS